MSCVPRRVVRACRVAAAVTVSAVARATYVQRVALFRLVVSTRALCARYAAWRRRVSHAESMARSASMGSAALGAGAVPLLGAVGAPMARPFRAPLRQAVGACATGHCQSLPLRRPACLPGLVAADAHVCAGTAGLRERAAAALGRAAAQVRHGCAFSARQVSRRMPCRVPRVRCTLPALPRQTRGGAAAQLGRTQSLVHLRALRCGARCAVSRAAHGLRAPAACMRALPAPRSSSRPLVRYAALAAQLGRVVHPRMLPPRRPRRAARRHALRLRPRDRAGVRSGARRGDAG